MTGFGAGQQDAESEDGKKTQSSRSRIIERQRSNGPATKSLLASGKKGLAPWLVTAGRNKKTLDLQEIDRIHAELRRAMHRTNHLCEEMLMKHDKDRTGCLTNDDLKRVFRVEFRIPVQRLTDEDIEACLDTLNVDGSGSLTIDEVATFMELGSGVFYTEEEDDAPMMQASDFYDRMNAKNKPPEAEDGNEWDIKSEECNSKSITQNSISQSHDLRKEAQLLFDYANGLKDKQLRKNMQIGYDVQAKLKKRIVEEEALVGELLECISRVEPSTYLMQMSIQQLQKARSNLWPALSIVKKRIKIRKSFNTAELERDYFQEAMVFEKQLLEEGRQTLQQRIEQGKEILQGLLHNDDEMMKVVDAQRDELKEDRTVLLVAQDKIMATQALAQVNSQAIKGQWKEPALNLMETTRGLEADSKAFREENDRVIQKIIDEAAAAAQYCKDCLDRHMTEMTRLMKQLEKEIFQSHHAMSGVEHTVSETRRQCDKKHHPLVSTQRARDQISHCQKHRQTIMESVQSKHDKLESTAQGLTGQLGWATALLEKLNESHEALTQDHHAKSRALKIDEQCLRVTPDKEEDLVVKKRLTRPELVGHETLLPSQLSELRMKIRAAASTGQAGRLEMDKLFRRLNPGGSGEMTDCEVLKALRRGLRIPKEVISDVQITALCCMLDSDNSGAVEVKEFAAFIAQEEESRTLKVRVREPVITAREKKEKAEIQERPPLEELPFLKPSVLQQLRRKIKCAASATQESLDALFNRFDQDHSGELEDIEIKKALRYALKIPKSVITDLEIFSWCAMLDGDNSGSIDIVEIVAWVNHSESTAFHKPKADPPKGRKKKKRKNVEDFITK